MRINTAISNSFVYTLDYIMHLFQILRHDLIESCLRVIIERQG